MPQCVAFDRVRSIHLLGALLCGVIVSTRPPTLTTLPLKPSCHLLPLPFSHTLLLLLLSPWFNARKLLQFVRDDPAAAMVLEDLYASCGELDPNAARQLDVTIRLCLEMHRAGLTAAHLDDANDAAAKGSAPPLRRLDSKVPPLRFE